MRECIGKVIQIHESAGTGLILEEGVKGRVRPFTFDMVDGYYGDRLKTLTKFSRKGLAPRVIVKFELDEITNTIIAVKPMLFRFSF